jgi:DNA-binding XRE family transcriptional regulator
MKKRSKPKKSGARNISELYKGMNAKDLRIIEKGKELLLMEVDLLAKLRKDRELTQEELADILEIRQSAISKLESQDDIMVKTLERYVEALGGELEIRAKFPNKVVTLTQFTLGKRPEVRTH